MAFSYSASIRLPLQSAGSSSAAASSSLSLEQQQQQFLQQNPQIQQQHQQQQFLQQNPQFQQQQQQQQQHPFYAMDSSSGAASSSSYHQYYEQQQRQQSQQSQSPRPLQGPRPAPLKVRKESYKIKKPPVAPGGVHHHRHHRNASGGQTEQQNQQSQLPRQPVIIYTVSPKVIHAKPGDFMSLVQRLTGVNSSPTAAAAAAAESSQPFPGGFPSPGPAGALSPAAKLATLKKAHQQSAADHHHDPYRPNNNSGELDTIFEQLEPSSSAAAAAALGYRSGTNNMPFAPPAILSPNPSSLPGISPSYFDSGNELNSLGFFQDFFSLSPMAASAAVSAAATSMVTTTAAPPTPPPPATPGANRGGFTDNSFLLSPPSGSHLAFASSFLMASPGGFWNRPAGLGFTPNAGASSPNWDLFGSFHDLH